MRALDRKVVFRRDLSRLTGLDDEDLVAALHLEALDLRRFEERFAPKVILRIRPDVNLEDDVCRSGVIPLRVHLIVLDQQWPVGLMRDVFR